MTYFVHASDFADMQDAELIAVADTLEDARSAVSAGDPEKNHTITDQYGYEHQ